MGEPQLAGNCCLETSATELTGVTRCNGLPPLREHSAHCHGRSVTNWFSPWRESNDWLGSGTLKSTTRAIAGGKPKNKLRRMNTIVETANVKGEANPLREVIPFWFAVSSPLLGVLLGLLGAWLVTLLSA